MKKIILIALVFMSATLANGQILYKISGNGLKNASYIVGTHHLVDASFVSQIPGIDIAMKETKQVYGEVLMENQNNPDTLAAFQKAMMLPENTTIKDVLDPEHYDKLNKLMTELIGAPLDNPMLSASMGKMRPSAIMTQIEIFLYLKEYPGAFDPNNTIDAYFQLQAIQAKKIVGGLETYKFQMELLLNAKTIEKEVEALNCLIDNFDANKKQLLLLTEAYRNQNAEAIVEAMNMKNDNECDNLSKNDEEQLLKMRNENWLTQMPEIMKKAPTLFVVGAAHLFNTDGVILLLRKIGYTVEPVKSK